MALVTKAEVQTWVAGDGQSVPTVDATVLDECIAAAGEEIIEETSRIWEKSTVTEIFDGDAAKGKCGEILTLRRFPVNYNPPTDVLTVTENGVSLVVAAGFSLSAGVIAERLGVPPSSLTFHLQHLHRAGLVAQRRVGRQLIYAADFDRMRGLVGFLTENCCAATACEPNGACEPGCPPGTQAAE